MKKQQGFTLIELVVVIIILGILAVVAAPKFINLQGDARVSTLKGMQAAIQSANTLVYSKASLQGKEEDGTTAAPDSVILSKGTTAESDVTIATVAGKMAPTEAALAKGLDTSFYKSTDIATGDEAAKTNNASWIISETGTPSTKVTIRQVGAPAACTLTYAPNAAPEFTIAKASAC